MLARIILRILLTCLLSKHMLLCMETTPNSLQAAIIHFANYENCHKFMVDLRWPDGKVTCPACGSEKVIWLAKTRQWKCYGKHSQAKFSLKTGTIFEDSPLPLSKWLPCAWLILNCKNGVSSYEIHRDLKVTQKTAWFMLSRLRLAMQDDLTGGTLNGEIEVDESFIGGKIRNMHKSRKRIVQRHGSRMGNKSVVFGMLERRTGKVRATVIPDRKCDSIQNEVLGNIERGATIISDEFANSWEMPKKYVHQMVNHLETYVNGNVHTQGIENFWSLLKRGLGGTYVSVEPFHLFRYVDEQCFRFNNRRVTDAERFEMGMAQIVGRRLTYKQLTGKEPLDSRP